jgi:hypothetical protein
MVASRLCFCDDGVLAFGRFVLNVKDSLDGSVFDLFKEILVGERDALSTLPRFVRFFTHSRLPRLIEESIFGIEMRSLVEE